MIQTSFLAKKAAMCQWLMPLPPYLYCFAISSRPAYFLVIVLVADAIAAAAAGIKMAAAAISQTCFSHHLDRLRPDFSYSFVSAIAIASMFAILHQPSPSPSPACLQQSPLWKGKLGLLIVWTLLSSFQSIMIVWEWSRVPCSDLSFEKQDKL